MDVKNKPTILDDSAGIYQKREKKSEKQKFKELSRKDKWQYFKDYYFKKLIVGIAAGIFAVYFLYTIWISKQQVNLLYTAAIDQYISEEIITQLQDSFGEYIGKNSKFEKVTFDSSYYFNSQDYALLEKLQTLIAVGEIDIFIAPEGYFNDYTTNGVMEPLNGLPTDLFSSLSNNFFFGNVRLDEYEDLLGPTEAYGIYIDETPLIKAGMHSDERIVLGIVTNSKNKENAIEFIRFIFNEFVPDIESSDE